MEERGSRSKSCFRCVLLLFFLLFAWKMMQPAGWPGLSADAETVWEYDGLRTEVQAAQEIMERQPAGAVQDMMNRISRYCSTCVEYQFGDEVEILNGERIVGWIRYNAATGTVYLDREEIKAYIGELAEKYDTYQKPREFQTSAGDWVTVTGGSYGWLLDQAKEAGVLEHLIRSGANRKRFPRFAHTAADWSHSDLGDTYVEVDLTNQHLWLYVDG